MSKGKALRRKPAKHHQPDAPGQEGWQARKSAATRDQIISAAIRCIVESSYAKATTMKIAESAGLSRGATLHHFPSKMDIIRAAVDYLHEKRLQAFRRSIREIPPGADMVHLAVHSCWAHVNHPIFVAFIELSVAARTDPELREILRPAQLAFDHEWYTTAREVFPEWQSDPKAFDLALNLTQQLMEGMAISFYTHAREDNKEQLLAYLEEKLRELKPVAGKPAELRVKSGK
ncbi:MAG: TetR/AcrR family transcriptional regulator [Xanthomonadales bacterium]|nr:TetR/AcrR family transcriptional regulator [Xanthomonadales bacterium]